MDKKTNGRAFVIRPFGLKTNRAGETIDFERVHDDLIEKALAEVGFSGGTTGELVVQGSIHDDMFREIISATLVIADISIHNANAFYELGIRRALRDRYTVIVRSDKHNDEHVFDLKTDRYMSYDPQNPSNSVSDLVEVIRATLEDERGNSPVFRLMPGLTEVDTAQVVVVPNKFRERVEQAENRSSIRFAC